MSLNTHAHCAVLLSLCAVRRVVKPVRPMLCRFSRLAACGLSPALSQSTASYPAHLQHSSSHQLHPRSGCSLTKAATGWRPTSPGIRQSCCVAASRDSNGGADSDGAESPGESRSDERPKADEDDQSAAEEQQREAAQTYRQIVSTWISSRETDLRGLASESSLALRNFLADPSVTVLGREYALSNLKDVANVEFDLSKFRGSFKSVANLTAWYSPRERQEAAEADTEVVVPPAEAWTQVDGLHPAAAAFRDGSLSFGFSAGGLLFSYYIGVCYGLHDLGVVTRDTKLGGSSAGSLIAACYHSGLPQDLVIKSCFKLAEDCRINGTRGRLGKVLREFLEELLPPDIHERCNDRAFVAVTRVWPRPTPELVSQFSSRDDLISALLTSCHIPWWFDSRPWTTFRGASSYDGGLTNFIPLPPSDYGVRVCCFPAKQLSSVYDIQISPDSFTDWEHGMTQMVSWAFEPAGEEMLEQFVEKGRADAKAWAEGTGVLALIPRSKQPDPEEVELGGQQKGRMTPTSDDLPTGAS